MQLEIPQGKGHTQPDEGMKAVGGSCLRQATLDFEAPAEPDQQSGEQPTQG
jgi:hypothetical protein